MSSGDRQTRHHSGNGALAGAGGARFGEAGHAINYNRVLSPRRMRDLSCLERRNTCILITRN